MSRMHADWEHITQNNCNIAKGSGLMHSIKINCVIMCWWSVTAEIWRQAPSFYSWRISYSSQRGSACIRVNVVEHVSEVDFFTIRCCCPKCATIKKNPLRPVHKAWNNPSQNSLITLPSVPPTYHVTASWDAFDWLSARWWVTALSRSQPTDQRCVIKHRAGS